MEAIVVTRYDLRTGNRRVTVVNEGDIPRLFGSKVDLEAGVGGNGVAYRFKPYSGDYCTECGKVFKDDQSFWSDHLCISCDMLA